MSASGNRIQLCCDDSAVQTTSCSSTDAVQSMEWNQLPQDYEVPKPARAKRKAKPVSAEEERIRATIRRVLTHATDANLSPSHNDQTEDPELICDPEEQINESVNSIDDIKTRRSILIDQSQEK